MKKRKGVKFIATILCLLLLVNVGSSYNEPLNCEEIIFNTNIGGGYGIKNEGYVSTLCFSARRNGAQGFVVAGHAGDVVGETFTYNGVSIGTVTRTAFKDRSTADAAFVQANSNVTPTNILKNNGAIWAAQNSMPVNTTVYIYGNTSKLQSGTITSTNVAGRGPDGIRMISQYGASYSATGGDSGAPVLYYEGNYGGQSKYSLVGLHSASDTTTSVSIFSPYGNIVNELQVSCITG